MKRRTIFWILSLLAFVIFYSLFGGITVEGYETPPIGTIILDVLTWSIMLAVFAGVISFALALFLMRSQRYLARVSELFPVVLFISTMLLFVLMLVVGDSTPIS